MLNRRLSDKIIAAHQVACDEEKRKFAELLHEALEVDLSQIGGDKNEHRKWSSEMEGAFANHEKVFGSIRMES